MNKETQRKSLINANDTSVFSTKSLVTMALFVALLSVSAYISIPLPNGTHITFLNFTIMLVALLFPLTQSYIIILVWMLMGAIGVPVYISGASGIGYLFNAWGGYTISFIAVSYLLPLFRGKKYNRIRYTVVAILSVIFVDLYGMTQMKFMTDVAWGPAFLTGFVPFIPLDIVKAVVVAQIIPAFKIIVNQD